MNRIKEFLLPWIYSCREQRLHGKVASRRRCDGTAEWCFVFECLGWIQTRMR